MPDPQPSIEPQGLESLGLPRDARIMIVDDNPGQILLLRELLQADGYRTFASTTDPGEATGICARFKPDLILMDLHMPGMDGVEAISAIRREHDDDFVPIIVLTGDKSTASRDRALRAGAQDFLSQPIDGAELALRVGNLVHLRTLHRAVRDENHLLEDRVRARTQALEAAQVEILQRLAIAAEFRDDATGEHTKRVGRLAGLLATELGFTEDQASLIGLAAPLHDVGKIAIPDAVLSKTGPLSTEEIAVVRTHPAVGARILGGSWFPLLQIAKQIAQTHHERWDGTGYPYGLAGDQIPLVGRITCVADAFDAMTHDRPYRAASTIEHAIKEARANSGTMFDPRTVEALERLWASERLAPILGPPPG